MAFDLASECDRYASRLLGNDYHDCIRRLGYAYGGAMARAVRLGYGRLRHGQDALGRYDTVVHDDRCAVVQRRVLEKYVLQQRHRQLRVEGYASVDYVAQVALLRQHHERARLRRCHLDAGRYNGLERGFRAVPRVEYVVYEVESLAAHSDHLQEVTQLGLEHYYDSYHAHAYYLA